VLILLGLAVCTAIPSSSASEPVGGIVVQPRPYSIQDEKAPLSPEFLSDPRRMAKLAAALRVEMKPESLSLVWPRGRDVDADCEDFRSLSDDGPMWVADSWMFRCQLQSPSGVKEYFYYDLDLDRPPVLDCIRHVASAPPGSSPVVWRALHRQLAIDFARDMKSSVRWTRADSSVGAIDGLKYDVTVSLRTSPQTEGPVLEIEAYSPRLRKHRLDFQQREDVEQGYPLSIDESRREPILKALRAEAPGLAVALTRPRPSIADSAEVFRELGRSQSLNADKRDLILYACHRWVLWIASGLPESNKPAAQAIDIAIGPYGAHFTESHWGGWAYDEGILGTLASRRGENRWTDEAFLEAMDGACDASYGDGDGWRKVLKDGEDYVRRFPSSSIVPEVMLHMAEAHETAWSLSKSLPVADYLDPARYRLDAPRHREKALDLYGRYLKLRPGVAGLDSIRHRMNRLRLDVDTDFHKYFCPDVC